MWNSIQFLLVLYVMGLLVSYDWSSQECVWNFILPISTKECKTFEVYYAWTVHLGLFYYRPICRKQPIPPNPSTPMQVWLPLLLIRQIFAPMKLEGPTKPATLGKVDDEEGGGKSPSQLTDVSGPALMLVVFCGGSKLDVVNSSCLWGFCHFLFVKSELHLGVCLGLKLCNVGGRCPNWPNSECWSDGGSNMDRNHHASECKVIVWNAAISHVAATLSHTIAWGSLINHRWPLITLCIAICTDVIRCIRDTACFSVSIAYFLTCSFTCSIYGVFVRIFTRLHMYIFYIFIYIYIYTCVSVCRWHVRSSVHVHICFV